MIRRTPLAVLLVLLAACSPAPDNVETGFTLPELGEADYHWIAARIFANETGDETKYLTYWGEGEDFPSLGIGHFIWFPAGVDVPFDESFPAMAAYLDEQARECSPMPAWLQALAPFDAPWNSKADFDAAQQSARMTELREWLAGTASYQARYIVASFSERWNALTLPDGNKPALTTLLERLLSSPQGLFAVIDYYNFKGLGSNPAERYAGEGWGLVQVLGDMAGPASVDDPELVGQFAAAAADRLRRRVANAPPERNEARWLPGWRERVAAYTRAAPALRGAARGAYRVAPYLQKIYPNSATLAWFSESGTPGELQLEVAGGARRSLVSTPVRACALAYHLAELRDLEAAGATPFRHEVVVDGLAPGSTYRYEIQQDGEVVAGTLRTVGGPDDDVRFAVYGDAETEPESTGKAAHWPVAGQEDRLYLVDQTEGYAANLGIIADERPDFVAIAGDLVQSGGEQRDWDEFWRQNAALAAAIPIVPARGNHDYYGGPGDLGKYANTATRRAIGKYSAYFDRPPYYVLDDGPIALIVIDGNNGLPERSADDTNWYLSGVGAGGVAPAWQEGSRQWDWLQRALARAQAEKQFTFVMFHHPPYSSGIHGKPPGVGEGENFASGIPLRALTEMLQRYGVDAVFNGHDELYEHSAVQGFETRVSGEQVPHTVHFFTVGIGGDGLRGADPKVSNPQRVFLADVDAPEVYAEDGVLEDGGRHYGHLAVDVHRRDDGTWQARLEPVYAFPVMNADGEVVSFERRIYDDVLLLESEHDD